MKVKTQWTSGPSHQTYHDGKPCDRYVGTVHFTGALYGTGWMRFTKQIIGKTTDDVEKQLKKYEWGKVVEMDVSELDPEIRHDKGEKDANANR